MVKLENLHKSYIASTGIRVDALKGINLELPEKGMVFILGKSGSGKTTLLNILGGLDKADSGALIVKNKDIKNFAQSDLDKYRNTFIGFIFQSFNVIDNFNVKQNIELACQLQGQKHKDITGILDRVGLAGYESRKPNELSGGQLQRVAIARALIKEPEIILADEPTGNLDSDTGKQILQLLKELSKEKLVIVITHDKESAETYSDRIIELSDGRIASDTGMKLEEEPTAGEQLVLRKVKLPISTAVKIGAGNFRKRIWRMSLTVLLAALAVMFFSVSFLINGTDEFTLRVQNVYDAGYSFALINKEGGFTYEEANRIITENSQYELSRVYDFDGDGGNQFYDEWPSVFAYYSRTAKGLVELNDKNRDYYSLLLSTGSRLPQALDEIVITNYYADSFVKFGYVETGGSTRVDINSPNGMLGKTLNFNDRNHKIVGILELPVENYSLLKTSNPSDPAENYSDFYEFTRISADFEASRQHCLRDVVVYPGYHKTIMGYDRDDTGFYYLQVNLEDKEQIADCYRHFQNKGFEISTPIEKSLEGIFAMRDQTGDIFMVLSIVVAIFAVLLIYNFIKLSITNNLKEIGILRAIGARGRDVFMIYLIESLLIAAVISIISVLFSCLGMVLSNAFIFNLFPYYVLGSKFSITVVTFIWYTPFLVIAMCVLSTYLATIIPISNASRKKPIEVIKL